MNLADPGSPPLDVSGDEGRREAARELAKAEYGRRDHSLLDRILDWIKHLFDRASTGQAHPELIKVVAFVAVVAVIALVVVALARAGGLGRNRRTPGAVFEADEVRTAADYRREAEQASAAGRWEDAIRARFRAVVAGLTEQGVLTERPSRTAHEAADEAGRRIPPATEALRAAAAVFDDVAYGGRRGDAQRYAVVQAADDTARAAARSARTGAGSGAGSGASAGAMAGDR